MADKEDIVEENISGQYYVDATCIDCDVCRSTAPDNFARSEENGYSFVFKQPENEEEKTLSRETMDACPVEAIGADG